MAFILKTAVSPRKARKTRKKSICYVDLAIHPLGDDLQPGISLNIFVLFVFFVDQMIFPGSLDIVTDRTGSTADYFFVFL